MTACSAPPMYWSTGSHVRTSAGSNGSASSCGEVYRKKYHDESMKVSMVSVSRLAGPPQTGQVVLTKLALEASGLPSASEDTWNSTSSGRRTGSWLSGTGTTPSVGQ